MEEKEIKMDVGSERIARKKEGERERNIQGRGKEAGNSVKQEHE